MIDPASGKVTCGNLVLEPAARLEKLLSLTSAQTVPSIAGTTHLALGLHNCDERMWGIGAMFRGERLDRVLLQMLDKDESEWSLQHEELRKQAHDKFLGALYGASKSGEASQYTFSWGSVESTLDRRGVQALIVVGYKSA